MNHKTILQAFERLLIIMDELREHCPWDKKQTIKSLRSLTIEEVYELSEAILENDNNEIKKELGDILLHLIFYAKIASETDEFNMADVIDSICDKLIHRHPHIYGNISLENEEDVKRNWEQLKLREGNKSVLSGIPKGLPAITKAHRIQSKVSGIGFDWKVPSDVLNKIKEELEELHQEVEKGNQDAIEDELGDVIFSIINYARFLKIDPEAALERTNKKFIQRFQYIENHTKTPLEEMSLEDMDVLWEEAKISKD